MRRSFLIISDILVVVFVFSECVKRYIILNYIMDKRYTYDAGFKRKVILCAEQFGNRAAGKHFSVNEANVRRWTRASPKPHTQLPQLLRMSSCCDLSVHFQFQTLVLYGGHYYIITTHFA